jgi:hypothetical protein
MENVENLEDNFFESVGQDHSDQDEPQIEVRTSTRAL